MKTHIEMAEKSQIATTIEQSKLLLAAGLDPESADMYYKNNLPWTDKEPRYSAVLSDGSPAKALEWYNKGYTAGGKEPLSLLHYCFPAWSLSRLIDLIADTGIPMNYGPMKDSNAVLEHAVNALEYLLRHADN